MLFITSQRPNVEFSINKFYYIILVYEDAEKLTAVILKITIIMLLKLCTSSTLKLQLSLSSRSFIMFKVIPPVQIKCEAKTIWGNNMAQKQ